MKKVLFLILLLPVFGKAQEQFSFADTIVTTKQFHRSYLWFELNKSTLRPESFSTLDSMVLFMQRNNTVIIEVQQHLDTRASDKYSIKLDQRRAQAVVDYLVSKGIDKKRLIAKGYGKTKLLIPDSQITKEKDMEEKEWLHQRNRRTEFWIISL